MVDKREEILNKYDTSRKYIEQTCRPELFAAMDEYMKGCCLELLEYVAKKVSNFWIDDNGNAKFRLSGDEELTKEQLFENFL